MATSTQMKCACESCRCLVETASAVQKDGQYYCSDACANGEGCDHAGCGCCK